jgi:hypothetical protein
LRVARAARAARGDCEGGQGKGNKGSKGSKGRKGGKGWQGQEGKGKGGQGMRAQKGQEHDILSAIWLCYYTNSGGDKKQQSGILNISDLLFWSTVPPWRRRLVCCQRGLSVATL